MQSQWIIERSGSTIRLQNSWFGGAKLYIDGDMKDFNNAKLTNSKTILLSGSFINKAGEREIIEVYAKSHLISVGFLVTSNGEEIFRDNF